ncbi:MAG: BioY family transporter [Dethiosulfovibrio peptidovorans]|nr:MAG: BioY family transporter [Dethiosulfovibrio peptidovorans]
MKIRPKDMALVALLAGCTAVGAFFRFPLGPAPISLQTFFTLVAGCLLGARLGALSQALYIFTGLMGVPVFTSGAGPSYILSPTFGFLLGFVLCAWTVGKYMERRPPVMKNFLVATFAGSLFIYLLGIPWLYLILTRISGVEMTFWGAFKVGCLVFLPGDGLKIVAVSWLASRIVPRLN